MRNRFKFKISIILFTIIVFNFSFAGTSSASFLSGLLPTYTLSGKIVNQNLEPMEGVSVVFVGDGIGGKCSSVTDSAGNYVLKPPAKTSGIITISKNSYRTVRDKINQWNQAGTTYVNNYRIYPDWVGGKIINQSGEPVEGAKVTFEEDGGMSGILTAITDANGNYRCTIPSDSKQYWITVKMDGYQTTREHPYVSGGQTWNYTLKWQ